MSSPGDARPDWLALTSAAATAGLNLALPNGWPTAVFIAASCVLWAAYVIVQARRHENVLRDWGFRADNFAGPGTASAVILVLTATVFAVYAYQHGNLRFPPHVLFLLLLYPVTVSSNSSWRWPWWWATLSMCEYSAAGDGWSSRSGRRCSVRLTLSTCDWSLPHFYWSW